MDAIDATALIPPSEKTLVADDGTLLQVADWPAASDAVERGAVLIMHGLGEHAGRYVRLARFLNQSGFAVRAYDHRGHGLSGGRRGDVPDDLAIVRDAQVVLADLASRNAAPPVLLGVSMGGLFAARLALQPGVALRGLVLASPALRIKLSVAQQMLLTIMRRIAPGFGVPNGLPIRDLSRDAAVVADYHNDPLVHVRISARLVLSMQAALRHVHAHAEKLAVPTLLLVAGADRLVDSVGSQAFHASLAAGVGTLRWYPGFYHDLFHEVGAERVFADLHDWMATMA